MLRFVKIATFCALILAVGCASRHDFTDDTHRGNLATIAELRSLGRESTTTIRQQIAIEGVVVNTNLFGEFPHEMVLQDATGGIVLGVDSEHWNRVYPFSTRVRMECNGLILSKRQGRLTLHSGTSEWGVTSFSQQDLGFYLRIIPASEPQISISERTFSEISSRDIATLVRFSKVRFKEVVPWASPADFYDTRHTITDRNGQEFTVLCAPTCRYNAEYVPSDEVTLEGIIDYRDGEYFLRIVNHGIFR